MSLAAVEADGLGQARPEAARVPVAVYRDHLLGPSETFVLAQGEHLTRYRAHYCGARRVPGLQLPAGRSFAVNRGGPFGAAREAAFKALGAAPALARHLEVLQPWLLHAHFADSGAVALPLAQRLGLPLVVSLHGYDVTVDKASLGRGSPLRRHYLRRMAAMQAAGALFLAVSDYIRGRALARGFPAERTVVHYTGVDTVTFSPDSTVERGDAVLFVGRLVEKKGALVLLRAMRRVAVRLPGAELIVCGEGPLRPALEREAAASGCRVSFLGHTPVVSVRDLMRRARVLCVPSTVAANGDAEGFGMVFAEAQAVGLPVASFATGGVPEAVADGETGLLVPDGDEAGLAEAIARLLQDRVLWRRMSRDGRERTLARFDLATQCRRLERLYDSARAAGRSA